MIQPRGVRASQLIRRVKMQKVLGTKKNGVAKTQKEPTLEELAKILNSDKTTVLCALREILKTYSRDQIEAMSASQMAWIIISAMDDADDHPEATGGKQ
jgi:hypothetical protein